MNRSRWTLPPSRSPDSCWPYPPAATSQTRSPSARSPRKLGERGTEEFTTLDGSTVTAPMAGETMAIPFTQGDGWQAATVPYAGRDLAMTFLVPAAGELDAVEASLDDELLAEILTSGEDTMVDLRFPIFDLDQRAPLVEVLKGLGPTAPFERGTADFAPITTEEKLFIADVLHQATVTVDEEGTEAATAVVINTVSESITDQELTIDRPFLFFPRHRDRHAGVRRPGDRPHGQLNLGTTGYQSPRRAVAFGS